jgi:hypothetical protein
MILKSSTTHLSNALLSIGALCVLALCLSAGFSVAYGDETQPDAVPVPPAKPAATPVPVATPVPSTPSTVNAGEPSSDKNIFAREKEARLETLRYRHLWIAFSLVWLIVFLFIRATWIRGRAVESRLDELKARLSALERGGAHG